MTSKESQDKLFFALQTFTEVNKIITSSHDSDETLSRIAKMIANRINVDACSIYIFDADHWQFHKANQYKRELFSQCV